MKPIKAMVLFAALLLSTSILHAQLKTPFNKSSIGNDVQKLISDFPNHFSHFSGELIDKKPQMTDYACQLKPEGAESSVITIYSSSKKTIASWKAVMTTTEDFDAAKKKFHSLYTALNNKTVNYQGKNYKLKAAYETPSEEKDFITIVFDLEEEDDAVSNLKVALDMHAELLEWQVAVTIYDRDRKDNERGSIVED